MATSVTIDPDQLERIAKAASIVSLTQAYATVYAAAYAAGDSQSSTSRRVSAMDAVQNFIHTINP